VGDSKTPHSFRLEGGEPFTFAALWEEWGRGGKTLQTCVLPTISPTTRVKA